VKQGIFISHAAPEDNYFATWLASKLKIIGYQVWLELDELKSGGAFWPEIENAIRNKSIKFLAIVSKNYVTKAKESNSGVFKELSCADGVRGVVNFKVPIRIDEVNFNDFPVQIMGLNSIDFYNNWQNGLEKLLDSLTKEGIIYDESIKENPLNFWLDSFKIDSKITATNERIFSNWFPFELPQKLFIHKPVINSKTSLIDIPFSYLEYSDRHLCFFPSSAYPDSIQCMSSTELDIERIKEEQTVPIDDFLVLSEPRKKIVELINKVVADFFIQKKMKRYAQSNNDVFYFPNIPENSRRISLKSLGKTNVAVTGKNSGNYWSFGISSYAILYPFPYLKISSHIIFETSELVAIDQDEQHTLSRKFRFDWYNKDWLDTMIGIMLKLSNGSSERMILIPIGADVNLELNAIPFNLETTFGYNEPEKQEHDAE
jgi:hypothetical protein